MSDLTAVLVTAPTVHVVGKTTFDFTGLQGFIEMRGLDTLDNYVNSPIKRIVDGTATTEPEQDDAEIMAEFAGRFCYDSFDKGRESREYIENVVEMRHGSVLEHVTYNLAITGVSRALTHELIRHRAGFAVSQESQRYVDAKDIKFVVPPILLDLFGEDSDEVKDFGGECEKALGAYIVFQNRIASKLEAAEDVKARTVIKKRANEAARALLPNASETKLTWTGNLRALRHFCELRGDEHADLEIRRLATAIAEIMMDRAPFAFSDMTTLEGDFGVGTVAVEHTKV